MGRWVRVAAEGEIVFGQGKTVVAGDQRIALFNQDGTFFAIDDTCPHQGGSLGEGAFFAGRVVCPWHSWVFDVRTGHCPRETHEPVDVYATRCINGSVEVKIPTEPQ